MSENLPPKDWDSIYLTPTPTRPPTEGKPVSWREILAVAFTVILADVTVYRGAGFTGLAVLFLGLTVLLLLGSARSKSSRPTIFFAVLIFLVSVKLFWCGFVSTVVAGAGVMLVFGTIRAGLPARFSELCAYPFRSLLCGGARLNDYGLFISKRNLPSTAVGLGILLPLAAVLVFATIFVMANPDLVEMVRHRLLELGDFFSRFTQWLPDALQIPFWIFCAWYTAGMLNPKRVFAEDDVADSVEAPNLPAMETRQSPYYAACRNTLVAVIVLFAAYLVFEFSTLFFRTFPKGFCYSGYSHEGAAWLTVALGVSTVILSTVFRGDRLADPRIGTLRKLAWTWSFLNIVLAVAVYNRLYIYIGFNGMTRMRIVGLLGMTAVLIGFVMVVRKIAEGKSFVWLLSRFAWTVLAMAFLNCVLPADWIVHRYNVARIQRGDFAPSVQITVHPCAAEGYLTFLPLVHCEDEIIREGIRAHLANKLWELRQAENRREEIRHRETPLKKPYSWTAWQGADVLLHRQLEANRELFGDYLDDRSLANTAFKRFADYAYQWY